MFLCMFAGQIIEYEDYDNTTDLHHVNEYEYEEYDERYGPAEREGEFSLNAQVPSKEFMELSWLTVWRGENDSSVSLYYLLNRIYQKKDRKESRPIWEWWETNAHVHNNSKAENVFCPGLDDGSGVLMVPNHHWLDFMHFWFCAWRLAPWFLNEMQNLLSSEERTLAQWATA